MKASLLYRIASVLLVLFAAAHLSGFTQSDPAWGVAGLLSSMHSLHFSVQGFQRSYWDLFLAAGYSVGLLYLFLAVLVWQMGSLPAESLEKLRVTAWALVLCFAITTVIAWQHLFWAPIISSAVVTLCLAAAALRSGKTS